MKRLVHGTRSTVWNQVRLLTVPIIAALIACIIIPAPAGALSTGYWHTSGNQILDSNNQPVRIAGINWYGLETTDEVAHGLWAQDYKTILNTIKANGYNVIRIPFSNQMIEQPIVPTNISYGNNGSINGDLRGLNSLQILDKIIDAAGSIGLRVILDNHRSEAGNSAEDNGLWYTAAYPESAWIADWQMLAQRYLNDPTVVGVDLRNEPHNATSGGACWDCGTAANDWHLAAERAGNAILAINPHLLIAVEGTDCYGGDCDWWGGNLEGAANSPVVLSVPNQLVYSAHDYGPNLYVQNWFNSSTTPTSLDQVWTKYWAYLSLNGTAPVWLGEFGTTNNASDLQNSAAGSQGQWFESLIAFLQANGQINWTYWALNGEDSYALLDSSYDSTPVSALKQQMLASIQSGSSTATPTPTGSATPSPTATPKPTPTQTATPQPTATPIGGGAGCRVAYSVINDWGNGFTAGVAVTNTGGAAINGWQLTFAWPGNQTIAQAWNASSTQSGQNARLANASWNPVIAAGGSVTGIGFNASYSGANQPPAAFYLNGMLCASASNPAPTPTATATRTPTPTATPTPQPSSTPTPQPVASCHVSYSVSSDWGSGFTASLAVTNSGNSAINGWRLTFAWPGNQTLSGGAWNANGSQSGNNLTLTNASWNPVIGAGGSETGIGFNAAYSGMNQSPTAFYLNGMLCH